MDERRSLYISSLKNDVFAVSGKAGSGRTQAVINLITKFVETKIADLCIHPQRGRQI